jgi:glycosyltransferase involved in cell wall biosynthesis
MPYSLLEAIAAGLPVVATRVGGTTSAVLDGRNGFVVDPGGAAEMSGCLTALLRDDELRGRMSSESLVLTRHFSIDRMVDRTLDIYSRLLTAVASVVPVAA